MNVRARALTGFVAVVFAGALTTMAPARPAACEVSPARDERAAEPDAEPRELLVTFVSAMPLERARQISAPLGAHVVSSMLGGKIVRVRVPEGMSLERVKAGYLSNPEVIAAEPNYRTRIK